MTHMSKGDTQGLYLFYLFFIVIMKILLRLNFTWLYLNIKKSLQGEINTGNCSAVQFRVSLCFFVFFFYLCFSVSLGFPKKQLT